ncbi:MAG: hypothetical protein MUO81_08120 [Thermoplasmata archaeon]|nr:hypothetical protein [Thermoplasmata archaeon]
MDLKSSHSIPAAVSGIVVIILLCLIVIVTVPGNSSAASFPKTIFGHVFEGDHSHPLVNAYVVVETKDSGGTVRQTLTDYTDSAGFYTVSTTDDWDFVATIDVTVYVPTQKTVSVADNGGPSQNIEVPFPYAIPQLPGIGGTLASAVILGLVAVVGLRKKPLKG